MNFKYKTTECVSAGHPDKVADVIADSVLDACLRINPESKVACEVMVKDDLVVLGGEITTNTREKPDFVRVVNQAVEVIGYTKPELKFCSGQLKVLNLISQQSPEINMAVVNNGDKANIGAGDQGIMWGYATNETHNFMPLGMYLARSVMNAMKPLDWDRLFGDCKTQITIAYDPVTKNPDHVSHVVVSCLHDQNMNIKTVRNTMENRYSSWLERLHSRYSVLFNNKTELIFNHAGSWTFGGPAADTGMTGRKIVVDAYGADCEVGGGAFSGKDCTKVDRSGAYAARYIAKNIVAAKIAKKCKVQLGYVIGKKDPVSFNLNFMGTGTDPNLTEEEVEMRVRKLMPLTPGYFIEHFDLRQPIFARTALHGHFGNVSFPWENLTLAAKLFNSDM